MIESEVRDVSRDFGQNKSSIFGKTELAFTEMGMIGLGCIFGIRMALLVEF